MNRREKPSKRTKCRRLGTPPTPVHRWKQAFSDYQLYEAGLVMATPVEAPTPSARKLASSLWELQDLPLPVCLPACLYSPDCELVDLRWASPPQTPPFATVPSYCLLLQWSSFHIFLLASERGPASRAPKNATLDTVCKSQEGSKYSLVEVLKSFLLQWFVLILEMCLVNPHSNP